MAPLEKLKGQLAACKDRLAEVAPKYMDVDRMVRLMLSACGKNPKILACTPESILQFSMKCAETGLEPIGAGGCWPIPYGTTLTFIPDYRGLVHCAIRCGAITGAHAEVVRQADEFDYELGLTPFLKHKPARGDRGPLESAYCIFTLPNGEKRFTVMDAGEINGIRARSKAARSGPWMTDESEMWKKTVIRRAMKPFAGMSSALDAAIEADDYETGAVEEKREPVKMPEPIKPVADEPKKRGKKKDEPQAETYEPTIEDNGIDEPPLANPKDWASDSNPAR